MGYLGIGPSLQTWDYIPKDIDIVWWIDADTYPTARFELVDKLSEMKGFYAASDHPRAVKEATDAGFPCTRYFNMGVWIATRDQAPLFKKLKEICEGPGPHHWLRDQTHANMLWPNWKDITNKYNYMTQINPIPMKDPRIIHFAGGGIRAARLELAYATGQWR